MMTGNATNGINAFWRAAQYQTANLGVSLARSIRTMRRQMVKANRAFGRQSRKFQQASCAMLLRTRNRLALVGRAAERRLANARNRLNFVWQKALKNNRRAMRHMAYVRGNVAYQLLRREDRPHRMRLRVLQGLHSGAQRTCTEGEAILIGSDKDCDIALHDSGVAAHHCILTVADGKVSARDIDARVRVEQRKHRLSRTCRSNTWWRVALTDDVIVGLGPAGRSEWDLAADAPRHTRAKVHRVTAAVAGFAGIGVVAAAMALSADAFRPESTPSLTNRSQDVESLLSDLHLKEIKIDSTADTVIRLHGVVPTTSELEQLRIELDQKSLDVKLDVRVGANIARDVREVLRLSGLSAKSSYKGAGQVEIIGTFPDEELLESVVSSRAMLEIGRLESVTAVHAGGKKIPEGKNVVAVVRGDDPYVVTADGSRYYVGAILPAGGTLQEINDEEVLITNGAQTERLDIKTLQANSSIS